MRLNSFKSKLTLLNVLMIYSVVFNISWGFCFYLVVNKESERTDLRTVAGFSPHACAPACVPGLFRVFMMVCGHLRAPTVHDQVYWRCFPCTFFLLAEKQPGLMHLNGPAGAHLFRDGPPLWRLHAGLSRCYTMQVIEMGFPNISIRGNTP